MKLPRRRTIIVIAACLLGGAIINVLVAWSIAWGVFARFQTAHHDSSRIGPHNWLVAVPESWPPQAMQVDISSTFGSTTLRYGSHDPTWTWLQGSSIRERNRYTNVEKRRGWPFRSMVTGSLLKDTESNSVALGPGAFDSFTPRSRLGHLYEGYSPPRWIAQQRAGHVLPLILPLFPIATGFTANTLIYASVLWLAFAARGVLRTARRRRRGQCLACGYDLAALPKCPECGRSKSESRGTIVPRLPPR